MATIKQIAEKCGVSVATVSKALNGYPDIGAETSRAVKAAAAALGYFPNAAARALKTNKTNNFGVLFIDEGRSGLEHEYFSSLLESFKSQAEEFGYDITFISHNLGGRPMSYLEHCRYRHCDGVMIACIDFEDEQVLELVRSEIPVITIDYVFNSCPAILSDNFKGMTDLTEYIIQNGHRRIAYIHGEYIAVSRKRIAAFHLTCQKHGIQVPEEYIKAARYHNAKDSQQATHELLSLPVPPTCILYPDDVCYIGGMNEFERMGLKVPADISAAGYDGAILSQIMRPRLTTLHQDSRAIGAAAAVRLVKVIEDPRMGFPDQTLMPGDLMEGQTVRSLLET